MNSKAVSDSAQAAAQGRQFFGHPRGLATLFMTEMWERFSYYGMRALLILYMTHQTGLGFGVAKAGAIYGLYTGSAYLLSLPGGWLADRIFGQRRAVLYGGILIALGNFFLAMPGAGLFYLGLATIVSGTGLLKPNVSTIVGQLYGAGDQRRDAGFSIFYMGINLGAVLGAFVCGYLGQEINWHLGFGAASFCMVMGLIQYLLGGKHLGEAGLHPSKPESFEAAQKQSRQLKIGIATLIVLIGLPVALSMLGVVEITPQVVSNAFAVLLIVLAVAVFGWLFTAGDWTPAERKRFVAIAVFFVSSALFWSAFEQAGSTLNLFADRSTDRHIFGFAYPASWFQSLNSAFIVIFAPMFAWVWIKLGKHDPSSTTKFSLGLVFVGLGFAVLAVGAARAETGILVSSGWLIVVYLLHTFGELSLSPVGLSAMTKLAPTKVGGMMMGVWFLSTSAGNFIGGRIASLYETFPPSTLFTVVAGFSVGVGIIMTLLIKPMKNLMGGVK